MTKSVLALILPLALAACVMTRPQCPTKRTPATPATPATPRSITGTVLAPHGDAIWGNDKAYIHDLYLGRVVKGTAFEVRNPKVERDEFNSRIVKVQISPEEPDSNHPGAIAWISLTSTDLVDRLNPQTETIE